jgi:phage/conjugal plasmid C-4 type zinc finger TraR family protein
MIDDADRAAVIVQDADARALALRQARAVRPASSSVCMVCGAPIPAERRAAITGCCTCVDCQHELERGMGR